MKIGIVVSKIFVFLHTFCELAARQDSGATKILTIQDGS